MDHNDSNPGMVERQLDETPMEGASGSDREMNREGIPGRSSDEPMQGSGSPDREGMDGSPADRDSMHGTSQDRDSLSGTESDRLGVTNTNSNDAEMRVSAREGGYGYDRPAHLTVNRDMEAGSRDTDQGTDRVRPIDSGAEGGSDSTRGGTNTTARDW